MAILDQFTGIAVKPPTIEIKAIISIGTSAATSWRVN
jgi:hypothetical protein